MNKMADAVSFIVERIISMEDGTLTFQVTKDGKKLIVDVVKVENGVKRDPKLILAQSVTRLD